MKVNLKLDKNMRFIGTNGLGHETYYDTHPEGGGEDSAPTPMEIMLECLGACSSLDVISIMRKKRRQVDNLGVEIKGVRAVDHPKVFTEAHLVYTLTSPDAELSELERAVEVSKEKYCSVSAMFTAAGCIVTHECQIKQSSIHNKATKMKKLTLTLFAFIFIFSACSKDKETTIQPPTVEEAKLLMPLAIGNYWIYRYQRFSVKDDTLETQTDTARVIDSAYIKGEKSFVVESKSQYTLYLVKSDGLYGSDFTDKDTSKVNYSLIKKYPVKVNDTFVTSNGTFLVLSLKISKIVPSGTFDCIQFYIKDLYPKENYYDYYCPGTGLITQEWERYDSFNNPYISAKNELIEYKAK